MASSLDCPPRSLPPHARLEALKFLVRISIGPGCSPANRGALRIHKERFHKGRRRVEACHPHLFVANVFLLPSKVSIDHKIRGRTTEPCAFPRLKSQCVFRSPQLAPAAG